MGGALCAVWALKRIVAGCSYKGDGHHLVTNRGASRTETVKVALGMLYGSNEVI